MITNRFAIPRGYRPPSEALASRSPDPAPERVGEAMSQQARAVGHHVAVSSPEISSMRRSTAWVRSVAAGLLFFVAAVVVQLWRQPDVSSRDTIWAEDGRIFTQDALTHAPVTTLLRNYAGYTQFATRALALGTRWLAPRSYAPYLAVSAAVVVALLGL